MKTVINSKYTNVLIIANHIDKPVLMIGANISTPLSDKYKWVDESHGIAHHRSHLNSIEIFETTEKGKTHRITLDIDQIKSIVKFYEEVHDQPADPDIVEPD
jgi:hypothetical protein